MVGYKNVRYRPDISISLSSKTGTTGYFIEMIANVITVLAIAAVAAANQCGGFLNNGVSFQYSD